MGLGVVKKRITIEIQWDGEMIKWRKVGESGKLSGPFSQEVKRNLFSPFLPFPLDNAGGI